MNKVRIKMEYIILALGLLNFLYSVVSSTKIKKLLENRKKIGKHGTVTLNNSWIIGQSFLLLLPTVIQLFVWGNIMVFIWLICFTFFIPFSLYRFTEVRHLSDGQSISRFSYSFFKKYAWSGFWSTSIAVILICLIQIPLKWIILLFVWIVVAVLASLGDLAQTQGINKTMSEGKYLVKQWYRPIIDWPTNIFGLLNNIKRDSFWNELTNALKNIKNGTISLFKNEKFSIYDKKFIESLPDHTEKWKAPYVVYISKGLTEKHKSMKLFIEDFYNDISEDKKYDYYKRLRNINDKIFLAQLNEFLVAQFCTNYGQITFNPTLENGLTPELIWKKDDQKGLLDVVTIFESKDISEEEELIDKLINYLSNIEHFFDIGVWYESVDKDNYKPSRIRNKLINYLDNLDPTDIDPEEELLIDSDGISGGFFISSKTDISAKSRVNFVLLSPPKKVEPIKAIESRIKSKLKKYKWEGPIFVAVCKAADTGADWEEVAEILYGPSIVQYNQVKGEYSEVLGTGGILMPKGDTPPRNTSLTGILFCEQNWNEELPTLKVKYLINPFAKHKVSLDIPSYPTIENRNIKFQWINTFGEELNHH
ncbi:hypothetical protein [Chengkuizengella axinellae]|uniref:Uncharacterized protein n=1 Tax=Chengkuizengella axinellae TaxID=3064388 RepID=A0ABT9J3U1_9BACL|nr:hypothetical protein [Chengkuizengella sp. 2205SS18-9]MDP5276163.1 hypothetical protein [Chengkuizengella sp. 2205SS18-9]